VESVMKIHAVTNIYADEDEDGIFILALVELDGTVEEAEILCEDLAMAYKIKTHCDTHIEPYKMDFGDNQHSAIFRS
jgi:hypothetical protein